MAKALAHTVGRLQLAAERLKPHASDLLWPAVAMLVVFEAICLRARFDTDLLIGRAGWWVPLARLLPFALPIAACCLAAAFVLGRERLIVAARELFDSVPSRRGAGIALAVHGLALVVIVVCLRSLLEGAPLLGLSDSTRFLAFGAGTVVWALAALAIAAKPSHVLGFLHATARPFALGALVGSAAYACAALFATQDLFWQPLSRATVHVSATLLSAFGQDVVADAGQFLVGTPRFSVIVTRFCSGYEGVGIFAIFALFFGACAKDRLALRRYAMLVLAGALLVWLANSGRIALLVVIGHHVSEELALDGFHTHAGWIPLVAIALGTVAIATRHPAFVRGEERVDGPTNNPTAAHLVPLLTLLAIGLVAGAFSSEPKVVATLALPIPAAALLLSRRFRARLLEPPPRELLWWTPALVAAWIVLARLQGLIAEPGSLPAAPGLPAVLYFGLVALGYVLVTPMAEELAFRGYLQRRLQDRDFELCPQGSVDLRAFALTSVAFGLLHGNLLGGLLIGFALSAATALRGRLSDAVFLHASVNASLVLAALATGHHELWLGAAR